jgi:hypothetical protein
MSYKKSTAYDAEKKSEKLIKMNRANIRRLCRRANIRRLCRRMVITGNPKAGQQPCPRQQEDAGLAQREPYGGVDGGLVSQLA